MLREVNDTSQCNQKNLGIVRSRGFCTVRGFRTKRTVQLAAAAFGVCHMARYLIK